MMRPCTLTGKLEGLLNRAGLPHIRFHCLRHTCAILLLSKGYTPSSFAISFTNSPYAKSSAATSSPEAMPRNRLLFDSLTQSRFRGVLPLLLRASPKSSVRRCTKPVSSGRSRSSWTIPSQGVRGSVQTLTLNWIIQIYPRSPRRSAVTLGRLGLSPRRFW